MAESNRRQRHIDFSIKVAIKTGLIFRSRRGIARIRETRGFERETATFGRQRNRSKTAQDFD